MKHPVFEKILELKILETQTQAEAIPFFDWFT